MSTQSVSVAVIAATEDERIEQYVVDGLERRGKEAYFARELAERAAIVQEAFVPPLLDEADALVYIISRASFPEVMGALNPLIIFNGEHSCFAVVIDDVWVDNALSRLKNCIDFRDVNSWDKSLDELNRRIDEAVSAQQQTTTVDQDQTQSKETYTCTFTDDSGTPVGTYTLTAALTSLLLRAQRLHEVKKRLMTNEPDLAFTSLLLACLTLDAPITQWFGRFVHRTGVNTEPQLTALSHDADILNEIAAVAISLPPTFSLWISSSVRRIFTDAQIAASNISGATTLDVRHIMAMFIYNPGTHTADYSTMNLDRQQWSNSFLGFISIHHPAELKAFQDMHRQVLATEPTITVTDVKKQLPSGPSTHIDSDRWTTDDTLGYDAYAHAIYRFLIHEKTKSPLTISIQAPWGGGKTSLMRMIQKALDPEAVPDDDVPSRVQNQRRLSVKEVLEEIKRWMSGTMPSPPQVAGDQKRERLTVWFNAWKYESVNQVWAGLTDAIMQQVAARMPVAERELFWLQLHRRRVDAEKIRQKVYDRIVQRVWRFAVKVLPVVVSAMVVGIVAIAGGVSVPGWILAGGSAPVGLAMIAARYFRTKKNVENEPADISLSEYVSAPNYSAELGFIHHAERDLQRVFECIPNRYKPLVVFIDDLDRCSPGSVAKVMEAVNLFLAGEFPNCIFVLGMDSELVAAALQAAHKDMIEALDNQAKTPVGWRFMDKFIQLPFIIPPCETQGIDRYTAALFSSGNGQMKLTADAAKPVDAATTKNDVATAKTGSETGAVQPTAPTPEEAREVMRAKIDEGIEQFFDGNPDIDGYIAQGKSYFRGNPREMKRFANTFRFHYFLRWAREAQPGAESPTPEQVVRWTVLAMKWPEVARWLHSGFGAGIAENGTSDRSGVHTRLARIEKCADADTAEKWKQTLLQEFQINNQKSYHWFDDGDLFRFFKQEAGLDESERLSAGAGRGLW